MKKTAAIYLLIACILFLSSCDIDYINSGDDTTADANVGTTDTTAPKIQGVTPIMITIGDAVSYKAGIAVTDDMDENPILTVDTSAVDLSREGVYTVIYKAKDASGNESVKETTLTIRPRTLIGLDKAYEMVDKILDEIITEDMTIEEKLYAVWIYLHRIPYTDISYSDNYVDNAYYFLEKKAGNCHCYYAASRLFMERMGYKTIDISNREDSDGRHFWNLVSVDDGKTWYHFDPCGWQWNDDYGLLCMVTDDYLIAFSYQHDFYSHDWQIGAYPETPKEHFGTEDINQGIAIYSEAEIEEAWAAKLRRDEARDNAKN